MTKISKNSNSLSLVSRIFFRMKNEKNPKNFIWTEPGGMSFRLDSVTENTKQDRRDETSQIPSPPTLFTALSLTARHTHDQACTLLPPGTVHAGWKKVGL